MTAPVTARQVRLLEGAPTPSRHRATRGSQPPRPQAPPRRRGPDDLDPRPGHIPGLDGIRALAILGVLVYHFTPTVLPGGFLGVDVFFVVSGFLITTLLLREVADHGRVDLPRFWLRRARRLFPALVTVVVISVAAARLVDGDLLVSIGRQAVGALTFSTNWLEIEAGASYFHSTSPLLFVNFWSLAVEEQFYLLWPWGLGLLLALTATTRHRLSVLGGLALASALWMAVLFTPGEDATRVYYGTDTHLFGLMLGAGLSLGWASGHRAGLRTAAWRRWRPAAVAGALAVLVTLMATLTSTTAATFRGGILLASLATVVLIAGLLEYGGSWRRLMSLRPLRWLGQRSYGIYLWHWPVLVILTALVPFAEGTRRAAMVLTSALAVTLLVSEASHRWIETPVRRQGFRSSLRRLSSWMTTPWQDRKAPRLVAGGLLAILLLAAIGAMTAPEKSETQRTIEEAEAALDRPGTAPVGEPEAGPAGPEEAVAPVDDPTDRPAVDPPPGYAEDQDGLLVPAGPEITAIGDSLVVTSADGLRHRFEGITFLATSNLQWKDALAVLEEGLAAGEVGDNVVVHFGTNAGVDEQALRAFLERLGPDRRVVLMNLYSRSTFVPGSNEIIARVAAEYPQVVVGDWHAAATAQPHTLQSDRIHPDIAGMHVYARVVAESFDSLARGG